MRRGPKALAVTGLWLYQLGQMGSPLPPLPPAPRAVQIPAQPSYVRLSVKGDGWFNLYVSTNLTDWQLLGPAPSVDGRVTIDDYDRLPQRFFKL